MFFSLSMSVFRIKHPFTALKRPFLAWMYVNGLKRLAICFVWFHETLHFLLNSKIAKFENTENIAWKLEEYFCEIFVSTRFLIEYWIIFKERIALLPTSLFVYVVLKWLYSRLFLFYSRNLAFWIDKIKLFKDVLCHLRLGMLRCNLDCRTFFYLDCSKTLSKKLRLH
jgi:hypothetical protein